MLSPTEQALKWLHSANVRRGETLGVALGANSRIGLASVSTAITLDVGSLEQCASVIAEIEAEFRPRWTFWSADGLRELVADGVVIASCWDIAAVHRLCFGGWRAEPARVWAELHKLPLNGIPSMGQLNLLGEHSNEGDPEDPIRPDGYLRPEWLSGAWSHDSQRLRRWAALIVEVCAKQLSVIRENDPFGRLEATAKSESLAELLCVELGVFGLPFRSDIAERLIESFVGPRPTDQSHADDLRQHRDNGVLQLAPLISDRDLRNPARVLAMVKAVGIDVANTRAWSLEPFRSAYPFIDALLKWRKADRIGSTFGYQWIDEHVSEGRLRGVWMGCDGAAGRMTASAGLHNLPADLRVAVCADPSWVFDHADLGQIEPRVLAAVSGDEALIEATKSVDLYAPIAARFGVERSVAKVAMLAAMYGQTSGVAGDVLRQMEEAYPTAMNYLRSADRDGRGGRHIRTFGGRLVRMHSEGESAAAAFIAATTSVTTSVTTSATVGDFGPASSGRGRYARNAVVQGAAAELFKVWAALVRSKTRPLNGRLVMCLHDELLVHAPAASGAEIAKTVEAALAEAANYWQRGTEVTFVTDAHVIGSWADAKG